MRKIKETKEPLDPVVDQVREARYKLAEECGFDLDRMIDKLQELEKTCGATFVNPPRRRLPPRTLPKIRRTAKGADGPMVEEVRAARQAIAKECGYDLTRMTKRFRDRQAASGKRPINLSTTRKKRVRKP